VFLDDYAGLSPQGHRFAIALGIPLFFWLMLGAREGMLWGVYKKTVPSVAASLSEVGPGVKDQLREISRRPSQVALGNLLACLGALILRIGAVLGWQHTRNGRPGPGTLAAASTGSSISPVR
jgi:hypothetical protein